MIGMDTGPRSLSVLRVRLELGSPGSSLAVSQLISQSASSPTAAAGCRVLFDINVNGEAVGLLDAFPQDIGLPLTLEQAREGHVAVASADAVVPAGARAALLPDHLITALREVLPPDGPLWVSIDAPYGYLPVLPWEAMLGRALDRPILRLPYVAVRPVGPRESLDIALCVALPIARRDALEPETAEQIVRGTLLTFLDQFPPDVVSETTLHVFADRRARAILASLLPSLRGAFTIHVCDEPPESESGAGTDWFSWIANTLGGGGADVVHFIGRGFLGRGQGFLVLTPSPGEPDEDVARISAPALARFLDRVGAWSVSFSAVPEQVSIAGLRLLQTQIAHLRGGPILLHDMQADRDGDALLQAFRYLYPTQPHPAPRSSAVSLIVHPDWDVSAEQADPDQAAVLRDLTLAGRFEDDLRTKRKGSAPDFLASLQRGFERTVAQVATKLSRQTPLARSQPPRSIPPPYVQVPVSPRNSPGDTEQPAVELPAFEPPPYELADSAGPGSERDAADAEAAVRRGTEEALRFTADVVARHLAKMKDGAA